MPYTFNHIFQEFSKLRQDLLKLLANVSESNEKIVIAQADADMSDKTRALALRDQQRLFRDAALQSMTKLGEQVELCLVEVRGQVVCLEDQVRLCIWLGIPNLLK